MRFIVWFNFNHKICINSSFQWTSIKSEIIVHASFLRANLTDVEKCKDKYSPFPLPISHQNESSKQRNYYSINEHCYYIYRAVISPSFISMGFPWLNRLPITMVQIRWCQIESVSINVINDKIGYYCCSSCYMHCLIIFWLSFGQNKTVSRLLALAMSIKGITKQF